MDIDIYKVSTGKKIHIMGTKTFNVSPEAIFPFVDGVFGPVMLPIPRTSTVLKREYGSRCLEVRWIKLITKAGHIGKWILFDESVRRWAMPYLTLRNVGELDFS